MTRISIHRVKIYAINRWKQTQNRGCEFIFNSDTIRILFYLRKKLEKNFIIFENNILPKLKIDLEMSTLEKTSLKNSSAINSNSLNDDRLQSLLNIITMFGITEKLCEPLETEDYVIQTMPDVSQPNGTYRAH